MKPKDSILSDRDYARIRGMLSEAALYEQLAEEAAELAHAASKCARILRGENPTPVAEKDARERVIEELSDVAHVARVIELEVDAGQIYQKNMRWFARLCAREVRE